MDAGAAAITPLYALIGSLGSAAAACFVVYLFMGFLKETAKRREELFERLTAELARLSRDNAQIISQVGASLDSNTKAIERLDATAKSIGDRLMNGKSRTS